LSHFAWGDNAMDTANASEDIEQTFQAKHNTLDTKERETETEIDVLASMDMSIGPLSLEYFNQWKHNLLNVTPTELIGYSNFIAVFQAHLDYIYASDHVFSVIGLAPMASKEVLEEEVALPSSVIPSDHVSLVADLKVL
jgi:mRNA deadenylase 3'-5' endonuclease subunit Ccr4